MLLRQSQLMGTETFLFPTSKLLMLLCTIAISFLCVWVLCYSPVTLSPPGPTVIHTKCLQTIQIPRSCLNA